MPDVNVFGVIPPVSIGDISTTIVQEQNLAQATLTAIESTIVSFVVDIPDDSIVIVVGIAHLQKQATAGRTTLRINTNPIGSADIDWFTTRVPDVFFDQAANGSDGAMVMGIGRVIDGGANVRIRLRGISLGSDCIISANSGGLTALGFRNTG